MAAERRQRTTLYCGPLVEVARRELPGLETKGTYVAEEKRDGAWCAWHTAADFRGTVRFESRVGLEFEGSEVQGLDSLDLSCLGKGCTLVGELETASETATATFRRLGFRRFFAFDVIRWEGKDLRDAAYETRTSLLRRVIAVRLPPESKDRVIPVRQVRTGFRAFYDKVLAEGGEGIVLKPLAASAKPSRADGKTPLWLRCKPWRTVDYVVHGFATTEKGALAARLALYRNGKPHVVLQHPIDGLELTEDGSRLKQEGCVVEMYGRELFASGALRHAQFRRWRTDKVAKDCTGEVILLSELS